MYHWWTIRGGRYGEDRGVYLKLGPVTFCAFRWREGDPLSWEFHILNRWMFHWWRCA